MQIIDKFLLFVLTERINLLTNVHFLFRVVVFVCSIFQWAVAERIKRITKPAQSHSSHLLNRILCLRRHILPIRQLFSATDTAPQTLFLRYI